MNSKSIGKKVYDTNKRLLGKINDIVVRGDGSAYLDVEIEGCSSDERCLISMKHIKSCGDYGYDSDIERDSLNCRRKKINMPP